MRSLHYLLFATSVLLLPQPGRTATAADAATYLGGTVKSIPQGTVGALDLKDSSELQFKSKALTLRLPYERIRSYQFENAAKGRHAVAGVPVPRLPSWGQPQVLDLSYRDETGGIATVSFRLLGKDLHKASWVLSQRIEAGKKADATAQRLKLQEEWWGDRYWKTTRNRSVWEQSEANATAVGTK